MQNVLVIEHTEGDGPGHFGEWLAAQGRPMTLVRVHTGDTVPDDVSAYSGLCVLGGPMSANDEHLDHIRAELAEYGAWDSAELADDAQNRQRIVWIAAANITEGA